jgi:amino acid transporter
MKTDPRATNLVTAWVLITGWLVGFSMFKLLQGAIIGGVMFPFSLLPIAGIIIVTYILTRRSPGTRVAASAVLGWTTINGSVLVIKSLFIQPFPLTTGKTIVFLVILGLNVVGLWYLWLNEDGNPFRGEKDSPPLDQHFE